MKTYTEGRLHPIVLRKAGRKSEGKVLYLSFYFFK